MTWQPISTAPKDGTWFWGRVDNDAITMMWHDKFLAFVSDWRRMTMAKGYQFESDDGFSGQYDDGTWYHDHSPTIFRPQWWMPMPPPPEDAP